MTENIENLVLEHLRAIRAKQGEHDERFSRMESRLTNLEMTVAGMRRDWRICMAKLWNNMLITTS